MNERKALILVSVGLMGLVLAAPPKGNAKAGETIYLQNCMGCHGAKGAGALGPTLAGKKSDVPGWSFEVFKAAMTKGVDDAGKPLKAPMPVWGKQGFGNSGKAPTDQQIADLQTYLKSIK